MARHRSRTTRPRRGLTLGSVVASLALSIFLAFGQFGLLAARADAPGTFSGALDDSAVKAVAVADDTTAAEAAPQAESPARTFDDGPSQVEAPTGPQDVATRPDDQVCNGLDSGKIDVSGSHETLTITAPDGWLISRYCVKAGSAQQGDGPEYYDVEPPQKTVTISHSSGKDISHYSFEKVREPRVVTGDASLDCDGTLSWSLNVSPTDLMFDSYRVLVDGVQQAFGTLVSSSSASGTIAGVDPAVSHHVEFQWWQQTTLLDTDAVDTGVPACTPNVDITKSASARTVNAGQPFTYTLSVLSNGDATAKGVVVTDTVASGLTIGIVSAGCTVEGQTVTCDLGDLSPGESRTITISVTATAQACGETNNVATVTWTGGSDQSSASVRVQCDPTVTITKSASTTSVAAGGAFSYSITVTNTNQNFPARDLVITDSVPGGLSITSVSGPGCSVSGQLVTCAVGDLAGGQSVTVTINVVASAAACPEVTNVASANWSTGQGPKSASSEPVTVAVICTPGINIVKSASATSVSPGGSFTYTVQVSNTGSADAENVVITDSVPAGLTITNVSAGCSVNGQLVTCDVGTVPAGGSASITITVTATEGACPSVTNTASVTWGPGGEESPPPDGQGGSASSNPVTVNVDCVPSVSLTKSASTVTAEPGDTFAYTVTVANTGTVAATNVVVTDSIPAGLTITNVSPAACSWAGQLVTCDLGTLGPGQSVTITVTVTATEGACPSIVNRAHVTYGGTTAGGSADSNAVTVGVNCEPDLQIVKNSSAPARGVESGDGFTYTITVTNNGNATATGVVVTDSIPAGLTIDDVDGPNCSVDGRLVTCDVGDLAAGASVTITITVTATERACPSVENAAHVEWDDGEGTASDDSNTVETDVDCVAGETVTPTPPVEPTTVTPPGGTAFTGPTGLVVPLGMLAVALLLGGTGLLFAGSRRRRRADT